MSETPRTDDPNAGYRSHYAEHEHNRELCRQLERELAAMTAERDGYKSAYELTQKDVHNLTEKVIPNINRKLDACESRERALREALKPFANYACDPPCGCHNCKARAALAQQPTEASNG